MTEHPTLTTVVADRLKSLRQRRGLSVRQLAEECERLGMPRLNQSVITNIEVTGRRQDVGITELFVLARALDAPPLALLTPEDGGELGVTPNLAVGVEDLVLWFAGERPPGALPRVGFEREAATIRRYRAAYDAHSAAKAADRNARFARKDGEDDEAGRFTQERDRHLQALAGIADSLVEAGMRPPAINPGWARKMIRLGWFRNSDAIPLEDDDDGASA